MSSTTPSASSARRRRLPESRRRGQSRGASQLGSGAGRRLLSGVYAGGRVAVAGEEREISRSGPAFSFLVGHANTSGVVFGDQTQVYRVTGRCLSAVMTDPQVQDDFRRLHRGQLAEQRRDLR